MYNLRLFHFSSKRQVSISSKRQLVKLAREMSEETQCGRLRGRDMKEKWRGGGGGRGRGRGRTESSREGVASGGHGSREEGEGGRGREMTRGGDAMSTHTKLQYWDQWVSPQYRVPGHMTTPTMRRAPLGNIWPPAMCVPPHRKRFHQPPAWGPAHTHSHQQWPPLRPPYALGHFPQSPWPPIPSHHLPHPSPPSPLLPHSSLHTAAVHHPPHKRHHKLDNLSRPMVTVNPPLPGGQGGGGGRRGRGRGGQNCTSLSLLTYNVLAQSLIEKNRYLYQDCTDEHLVWENRRKLVLREVTNATADIVCFQEVEEEHYHSWFIPELAGLGYTGIYKKRTGSHSDGCALFYKSSGLDLVEWKGVEFQRKVKVLNRDNVAIVAKFRVSEHEGKRGRRRNALFCVATTHLLFNPKAGDVKLAQVSYLLAELHLMASSPSSSASPSSSSSLLPCLLCGDLNSIPLSPLLSFLETGSIDCTRYSAPEVAGYHKKNSSRLIPVPLLPDNINIGPDSQFKSPTPPTPSSSSSTTNSTPPHSTPSIANSSSFISSSPSLRNSIQPSSPSPLSPSQPSPLSPSPPSQPTLEGAERTANTISTATVSKSTSTSTSAVPPTTTCTSTSASGSNDIDIHRGPNTNFKPPNTSIPRTSRNFRTSPFSPPDLPSPCASNTPVPSSSPTPTPPSPSSLLDRNRITVTPSASSTTMDSKPSRTSTATYAPTPTTSSETPPSSAILSHPFSFSSAYPHPTPSHPPSTVTTYHSSAFETVDYIHFTPVPSTTAHNCTPSSSRSRSASSHKNDPSSAPSPSYSASSSSSSSSPSSQQGFHLLSRRVLLSSHTLLELGPQPHRLLPSDHLRLQATLQLIWK